MRVLAVYRALGPIDLRNVRRDKLLVWAVAGPVIIALLYRYGIPPLTALLQREIGFDLTIYYGLLMSFFVLTAPTMIGMIVGFLLLDERDEHVMTALLVTPLPLSSYLFYRLTVPIILGLAVTLVLYPVAGQAPVPAGALLTTAFVGAFSGPIMALFLAVFAENKVAGFALVKVANTINMIPVAAFFVEEPWQWAAGIVPAYWPLKVLWRATEGGWYGYVAIVGCAVNAAVLLLLLRRFRSVVHR